MTDTIFYLSSCSTCTRILKELGLDKSPLLQDIKSQKITADQLDNMAKMAGGYEKLFSRRAIKYRSLGLNEKRLGQDDYRQLILDEYTFLQRPVFVLNNNIYVGSSKNAVESIKAALLK
ncbi:MAG: ArsC/Spx/MgsR family protein [Vicingaceae bacterium]